MTRAIILPFALLLVLLSSTVTAQAAKIGEEKWTEMFGTSADGTVPTVLKDFRRDMSPADAEQAMKKAGKPNKFGFAKLPLKGRAGAKALELWFMKDKETNKVPTFLRTATIELDPVVMKDRASYDALLKVLTEKYGPIPQRSKPDAYEITWAIKGGGTAQVWKIGKKLTFKFSF